jgi:hypothetical protein
MGKLTLNKILNYKKIKDIKNQVTEKQILELNSVIEKYDTSTIKNRLTNKIQLEQNIAPGNTLSSLISIQQNNLPQSGTYTSDVDYLEVVFSPQNEINDDISDQLGGFNIGEFISPDEIYGTSSLNYYPALRDLSEDYFKKYNTP